MAPGKYKVRGTMRSVCVDAADSQYRPYRDEDGHDYHVWVGIISCLPIDIEVVPTDETK